MAFAENLAAFFQAADFSVSATFGAETAQVILDAPGEVVLGQAVSADYSILYPATQFAALKHASSITVDGIAYIVREGPFTVDDGKLKRATLSKV